MSSPVRILAFAGSARRESLNKKLLAAAVQAVREAGGEVTPLDLNDLTIPLYHGDQEDAQGLPPDIVRLVGMIQAHDALLIASPEYNSFLTPLMKNTIDWCSRPDENPFEDKVVAVISASPGIYGGVRSAQHTRHLLLHLGCHVVPAQCSLSRADEAFDAEGRLTNERTWKNLRKVAAALLRTAERLRG